MSPTHYLSYFENTVVGDYVIFFRQIPQAVLDAMTILNETI